MAQNYLSIKKVLDTFAENHAEVKRFKVSFQDEIENFSAEQPSFPILYSIPQDISLNENDNVFTYRIYVLDLMQSDKSNESTVMNTSYSVLRDLANWMNLNLDSPLTLMNSPRLFPVNNFLMDGTAGFYGDFEFETTAITSDCTIPFLSPFQFTGATCDITYNRPWLTCETLTACTTFQNYVSAATPSIRESLIPFGSSANTLTTDRYLSYYPLPLGGGFVRVGYDYGLELGNRINGSPFQSFAVAQYFMTVGGRNGEQNIYFNYNNRDITYTSTNGHKFIGGISADTLSATTLTATTFTVTPATQVEQQIARFGTGVAIYDNVNGFANRNYLTIGYLTIGNAPNDNYIQANPGTSLNFISTVGHSFNGPITAYNDFSLKGPNATEYSMVITESAGFVMGGVRANAATGIVKVGALNAPYSLEIHSGGFNRITVNDTSGAVSVNSLSAATVTARLVEANSGGTLSASKEIVSGIITDTTAISLISNTANWNASKIYTGTTLTNVYQGQVYADTGNTYFFFAMADNSVIRMARI